MTEDDTGFMKGLNNWMGKPVNSLKYITNKMGELEIANRLLNTGNVIAETGSTIVNKGTEITVYTYIINIILYI
jgi:hypothetical protein